MFFGRRIKYGDLSTPLAIQKRGNLPGILNNKSLVQN
jgi:hypothetical protein